MTDKDYEVAEAKMKRINCKKYVIERTLLRKACKEGRLDMLKYYENKGFRLNYCSTLKAYKLLEEASRWGNKECAHYLIKEHGYDHTVHNYLPIRVAIKYNHLDVVKMYKKLFPLLFQNWENESIMGHNFSLHELIHKNAEINSRNSARTSIFVEAAKNSNLTLSKYLIEECNFIPRNSKMYDLVSKYDFFKLNDYIKVFVATNVTRGTMFSVQNVKSDFTAKLNYITIKGFMIKLMVLLNGRLGPIGSNRYLITEMLKKELEENIVNGEKIHNKHHNLFLLTNIK